MENCPISDTDTRRTQNMLPNCAQCVLTRDEDKKNANEERMAQRPRTIVG